MSTSVDQIRLFWDEQAIAHGEDVLATMPDRLLKELELQAILRYLPDGARVLDVGCGNGYSLLRIAGARPNAEFLGLDYSAAMIEAALRARDKADSGIRDRVTFAPGDVLNLSPSAGHLDVVVSDRCLINLATLDDQRRALREIHHVLRPGGVYLMCEDTQQGLAQLNNLRRIVGLYEVQTRWHNLYLDEAALASTWNELFTLEQVDNFSSLYYIASRIFNGKLAAMEGKEPSYEHPINQIAAQLPSVGDYGPLKLFVLRKREQQA